MEQENQDPVDICINALQTATNKEIQLEQAIIANKHWWTIDESDKRIHPFQFAINLLKHS